MKLFLVCAAAFLAVAWLAFNQAPRNEKVPTPPKTDFMLGHWYCCLLDDHPVRVSDPSYVGGFGGQSGRPVTD